MNTARDEISYQIEECRKVWHSFEYFLDEYVWIEDKENHTDLKLELWPKQREILQIIINEKLIIILKTQQVGLTWLAGCAYPLWQEIRNPLDLTVAISVNEDMSQELLQRVYFILDRLPPWLYPPIKTRTKSVLEFQHINNLVSTFKSLPTTEMGGQGKTPNRLILDETCKNRLIREIYNASYPGIQKAGGQIISISNSLKTGAGWGWTRDYYTDSMKGKNDAKRIFLAWNADPSRPKDFRARVKMAGMDDHEIKERYPESEAEALEAASGGYFGDALKRHNNPIPGVKGRLKQDKQTKEIEFIPDIHGPLEVWRHPYHLIKKWDGVFYTKRYAIGSDVSEGLGNTYSVAPVKDRLLDETVAKLRSNRIDAVDWAEQLRLLSLYYGNHIDRSEGRKFKLDKETALVCVEVNGSGQTTVKELIKKKVNQYVRMVPDVVGSGLTHQYGWPETPDAKYELANDLKQWFKRMRGRLYDAILIDQCSIFIIHPNGRLAHEEGVGKFDDDVIGYGLMEQASLFMGEGPKKIIPPVTGWRADKLEEGKKAGIWAS
jgi:hypothetical protein